MITLNDVKAAAGEISSIIQFIRLVSMPICYHKLLKLARTIADMADLKDIRQAHLLEAISYRQQDKRQH